MAKLNKEKWLSSNTFEFEKTDGEFVAIKSETGSDLTLRKEIMPDGSFTKYIHGKLKKKS